MLNPYLEKLSEFPGIAWDQKDLEAIPGSVPPSISIDWQAQFTSALGKSPDKIVVEVGCSNGLFLCSLAKENPNYAFVGIDWKFKNIYKAAKRAHDLGLRNVCFLRARAQDIWERTFKESSIQEVWIFFPDPWAKKSQRKHRIMGPEFLSKVHRSIAPRPGHQNHVYFKTDHPGYYQWVLAFWGQAHEPIASELYDGGELLRESGEVKSKRARQYQVRMTESETELPATDAELQRRFDLVAGEQKKGSTLFGGTPTLFESLFLKDGLPIYSLSLKAKAI